MAVGPRLAGSMSGPSYEATGSSVAHEEIELRFDDLVWLANPAMDGTGQT